MFIKVHTRSWLELGLQWKPGWVFWFREAGGKGIALSR